MADAGYVRVHRTLLGHAAFRNDSEAMAFAWMVLRASWRPQTVRYKEHTIALSRGDLSISIRDLSVALDRPKGWVERLLNRLKNETMVRTRRATQSRTAPLVISIVNYDTYQHRQDGGETRGGARERTAAGQRPDREQVREEVNKEITPIGVTRARVLPVDFEPSDGNGKMAEIARGWSPSRRAEELERWRAHHRGKGSRMVDWDAAWQTWIGNSVKFASRPTGGGGPGFDFGYGPNHSGIQI